MRAPVLLVAVAACSSPSTPGPREAEVVATAGGDGGIAPTAPTAPTGWPVTLAVSDGHGCVTRGGGVWCWGDNRVGQLGDGTVRSRDEAVRVAGIDDARAVVVTMDTSCTLRTSGEVTCWGGEDKPLAPRTLMSDGVALSASIFHACALTREGSVRCWGYSPSGAHGQTSDHVRSAEVVAGVAGAVEVAASFGRTCARQRSGAVSCWGAAWDFGVPASRTPVPLPGPSDIDAMWGGSGLCLRRTSGEVRCERRGHDGDELLPIDGWAGARQLASTPYATCAIDARGAVTCASLTSTAIDEWWLQLERDAAPAPVPETEGAVVVAAAQALCIARADGEVACRGARTRYRPQAVPELPDAVELVSRTRGTCARRASGEVVCWGGESTFGAMASSPEPIAGIDADASLVPAHSGLCTLARGGQLRCGFGYTGVSATDVPSFRVRQAAMSRHACAVRMDGKVACWGENSDGELGDGTHKEAAPARPAQVRGVTGAVEVAVGFGLSCARLRTGAVRCWGDGALGEIGGGGVTDAVQLAMGLHFACARRANGTVRCWGVLPKLTADQPPLGALIRDFPGVADAVDVAAGDHELCLVRATGSVVCAGTLEGRARSDPPVITVSGINDAVRIVMGERHACVLRRDRTVACWGYDGAGAVGGGATDHMTRVP